MFDFSGKGDVERQPTARLPPHPLQPAARTLALGIFNRRPGGISALDLGVIIIAWRLLLSLLFYFYFLNLREKRRTHTKLWDLFNMILANAFCLFFFLGEYLQVASLGATPGCARSGARWKLGTRGWGWGLREGRRGRHRESAVLGDWAGAPGRRTAREVLKEGAVW